MTLSADVLILLGICIAGSAVLPRRGAAVSGTLAAISFAAWASVMLANASTVTLPLPYPLPPLTLELTGVSGLLAIAYGLFAAGTIWALIRPDTSRRLEGLAAVLTVPAVLLVLAGGNLWTLLMGWEALGVLSFLLVAAQHPGIRQLTAARSLLAFAELGVFALYGLILLSGHAQGSIGSLHLSSRNLRLAVTALAIVAFGSKAGIAPLQFWMPVAEPQAPGPAAGLLSGPIAMVAAGALLRILAVTATHSLVIGSILIVLGLGGSIWGALGSLFEVNAKRVLALTSAETMNLAAIAIGVDLVLRHFSDPGPAAAAFAGAVMLLLMHAGSKASLFTLTSLFDELGLGQDLNALGGLAAKSRGASMAAALASVGLMGLPPLGGFVAEWLLLESCFMPVPMSPLVHGCLALTGALVALVTAMSLTAYLRWFGMAFLGPARSKKPLPDAFPPSLRTAWIPAALMASGQVVLGVGAAWFLPWIEALGGRLSRGPALVPPLFTHPSLQPTLVSVGARLGRGLPGLRGIVLVPDGGFSILSPWDLATAVVLGTALVFLLLRWAPAVRRVKPWAGGVPEIRPDMAYTASGLTMPLRLSFATVLAVARRRTAEGREGLPLHPTHITYRIGSADRTLWLPKAATRILRIAGRRIRLLQSGSVGHYVFYVLIALGMALLAVIASAGR